MTSTRPYLLRALYDWIVDNGLTPHVLVDATTEQVEVPKQHVEDNRIVLNISPNAVRDFEISNEFLSFSARFAGRPQHILAPIKAVLAIYARENGKGMLFPEGGHDETGVDTSVSDTDQKASVKKSHLKVIK